MNFREFVQKAQDHLATRGWRRAGHNGVWPKFVNDLTLPLPAAVQQELSLDSAFAPIVEEYLLTNGWVRSSQSSASWPVFHRGADVHKKLPMAMLEQLKAHRLNNNAVSPPPTPADMKKLLHDPARADTVLRTTPPRW